MIDAKTKQLGNRRVTGTEQFYTPVDLALRLTGIVEALVPNFAHHPLVEPAGGTGAFIDAAITFGSSRVFAVDTHPLHPLVTKANFLSWDNELTDAITLSNPPFGRNNSLTVPFFNRAARFSSHIAFVVPRSWRKWSVQNRLDRNFELIYDEDLQVDYVDAEGEPIWAKNLLRTCFQVWRRTQTPRPLMKVQNLNFIEKTTPELADLAITVFGYGCGRVKTEFPRVLNTTQMYIRVLDPRVFEVIAGLDFGRFSKNTAYTEALSLPEIHYLLNISLTGEPALAL